MPREYFCLEVMDMKFSPTLSEIEKLAATGKYDVAPVSCEILSDFTTPIETIKILKNISKHCYMIPSSKSPALRMTCASAI